MCTKRRYTYNTVYNVYMYIEMKIYKIISYILKFGHVWVISWKLTPDFLS